MMKILSRLAIPLLLIVLFSACRTQQVHNYLENLTDTSGTLTVKFPEPLIQKNDQLGIVVFSDATDGGATDAMYNKAAPGVGGTATQGYIVDNDGFIVYPTLGKIKAEGLTKAQLADIIKDKLDATKNGPLVNPSVIVHLLNFKITLLGEVQRPGTITVPIDKLTIFEAIGLAGDISIYGKKDDIVVLREVDGVVEHGKVDLSTTDIFESPYYFLKQNDVVLINPNKNKARLSDQVFNQRLGIAFSLINTIALLYNIFR